MATDTNHVARHPGIPAQVIPTARKTRLRAYCYLDRLQPRYAAFLGTVIEGDLPVAGMAALFVEVAPGIEIFRLVDAARKVSTARPGAQVVEREYGLLELHSRSAAAVLASGQAVLNALGLTEGDRLPPALVTLHVIPPINAHQAQLINRGRRGAGLLPATPVLVAECAPAAYANLFANEAEKKANVHPIHVTGLGQYGRVWLSGTEKDLATAQAAIESAAAQLVPPP